MQKRNLIHKLNTKILCVLILFVLIYITAGFVPQTLNISYGATYTYTKNSNNLPSDFEQKYPGYVTLVQALVASHPNWTFKLYETGLSWEATINSEYQNHTDSMLYQVIIQMNGYVQYVEEKNKIPEDGIVLQDKQ